MRDGNVAGERPTEHRQREQRIDIPHPAVDVLGVLLFGEADPAERRAHEHAHAIGSELGEVEVRVVEGELGGGESEL